MLDADDKTISTIDPKTRSREIFSTSSTPTDLGAVPEDSGSETPFARDAFASTTDPKSVSRLDPETRVRRRHDSASSPQDRPVQLGISRFAWLQHIAVTRDAVWVVDGTRRLPDRPANQPAGRRPGQGPHGGRHRRRRRRRLGRIELGGEPKLGIAKIDPAHEHDHAEDRQSTSEGLTTLAVGARDVWAADPFGGLVWRIDPGRPSLPRTIPVDIGVNLGRRR